MAIEDIIRSYEGLRLKPYKDSVGKLTIGIGRNLTDHGISENEADYLLQNDILDAEYDLSQIFGGHEIWNTMKGTARMDALTDLMFNIGMNSFLKFEKMIQAIWAEDWNKAADELLDSKYAAQVGQRALDNAERLRNG